MPKTPVIEVRNLVKSYGDLEAVKGISFDVYEGEIFGLLGPNGAGKTTTLEIMETLRQASGGDVRIYGHSIHTDPALIKALIGVQLQQSGFYPSLRLGELIQLFGSLYNTAVDPDDLLKQVNLEDRINAKYTDLSGGQKQRFSIATTLIHKPKVVFLDEPSTGLDPKARRDLWELIRRIQAAGTTIILTTHYMDEAEELCDRVAIIDLGRIIALDTPDALIDQLVAGGFSRPKELKQANLEDVFLARTGKELTDE